MKQLLIIGSFLFGMIFPGFSQVFEGKVTFNKTEVPGLSIIYPYAEKTVEDAIESKIENMGYKMRKYKGFQKYEGVSLPELGSGTFDLYFEVDKKSRRDRDKSTVNFLIAKGYENFMDRSQDPVLMEKAKRFLETLLPDIEAYNLELDITKQEEELRSAEKKYEKLVDQYGDMERKVKKLQEDMVQNQEDQKKQVAEIEKQKNIFEALKFKRKG